jgi:ADP-ribose pyrophosphatase YjhB (NUDIX family)
MELKVYDRGKKAPKPNQSIQPGACAVILNKRNQILLHKRDDSEFWALPGGGMEIGESISECCLREIKEELNLIVEIEKLIGIYTSPECVFEWRDGNESKGFQVFVVAFLCRTENDSIKINNESTAAEWFLEQDIKNKKTLPYVKEAIDNALHSGNTYFD